MISKPDTEITPHFGPKQKRNSTELSKYIWELKDKEIDYEISWRILSRTNTYSSATKRCILCLREKCIIICQPEKCTLNKRNELQARTQGRGVHGVHVHHPTWEKSSVQKCPKEARRFRPDMSAKKNVHFHSNMTKLKRKS